MSRPTSQEKRLTRPRYDGGCIANIPETIAKLLGVRASRPLKDERLCRYSECENVVLLLLDGFGAAQLRYSRENHGLPSFERLFSSADFIPITSVFPSTTSSAMASLHTGLTPQEHGIVGYTMFISQLGTIAQMLRFSPITGGRSLFDSGLDPKAFMNAQTIHERLTQEDIDSTVYVPSHIIDSGLSRITYGGADVEPCFSFGDTVIRARRNLEEEKRKSFHFVYYASPDTVSHARGPYTEEFSAELESLFAILERNLFAKLDRQVAKKTLLLVSGDHGAVRVSSTLDVAKNPELVSFFRMPPTGDSRASIMNLKPGAMDQTRSFFHKNHEGEFQLFDSTEMLKDGYFGLGRVKVETPGRIGDLIAVPRYDNAIDNSQLDSRGDKVPGRHGGLSEEEIEVPLIAMTLERKQ
jgi:predicted AlkP superfamily pyrophosphatase or phosphodiesterase